MLRSLLSTAFPPPLARRRFTWPWQDRAGRWSGLRAAVFVLLLAPAAWVGAEAALGLLGAEPWKAALKEIGLWAIRLLLLALMVTPLGRMLAAPRVLALRRLVGLVALAYAGAHLLLYVGHENFRLGRVGAGILLRFYLTLGFAALLLLLALGWTSTDGWIRALGPRWKRLHALIFPAAALGVFHFFLQSKAQLWEAVAAAGVLAWLLLWRALPVGWRGRWPVLLALAPLAGLAAAAIEYAWYALATALPAGRILAANLDLAFGPRPAVAVAIGALAAVPVALAGRWFSRSAPDSRGSGPAPAGPPVAAGNPAR